MFVLFQSGKEIGRFNPVPQYWEELTPQEKEKWRGDAALVADLIPAVSADSIARYFIEWDLEDDNLAKAYPEDEFSSGDCWQMCDFLRKVGLDYPMGDDGAIHGDTFRLWTKLFPSRKPGQGSSPLDSKKPWWKFW